MRKIVLLFLIQCLAAVGLLFSAADYKIEKNLTVPAGETYPHSVISWKGTLEIKGRVEKSALLIGGTLKLDGVVEEDVICIASNVKIGKNAVIKRDLFVIGGIMEREDGAVVNGEFFYFKFDLKKIENTVIPILSDAHTISFFKGIKIIVWFIITLIVFAFMPGKVDKAQELFDDRILKTGTIGLLAFFGFIFLFFISIILSFVVIGIPLLVLLLIAYFVTFIVGRTILFYYIGVKFSNFFRYYHVPPVVYIMEGVIFYALLKFLPMVGPIFIIALNIFEVGIGVSFLLGKRFKLR